MKFDLDTIKKNTKGEASIAYELYRICSNAIEADSKKNVLRAFLGPTALSAEDELPKEEFGYPRADSETLLREDNFAIEYIVPEFHVLGKRTELLVIATDYNNYRPYLLVECKKRATTGIGISYAKAIRQAIRYAKALPLVHFAVFDGWVIILSKTSYPYLLGIYDAKVPESLTPMLLRKILQGVRQLERNNTSPVLNSLQITSGPRDPDLVSSQVLSPVAKMLLRGEREIQPERTQVDTLVKQWRESFHLP